MKEGNQIDAKGNVIHLALDQFNLKELPRIILKFTNLEYLSLYKNQLVMLPPEISQLTQLTILNLASNKLSTLPSEISQLTQLTDLDLARCPFHKFAASQAAARLYGLGGYKARSNRWGRELNQARP